MATNLFSKAATYRKKHKGMTMPEAVKAVSKGAKVSGTKKKAASVTGVKKRKRISGPKKVASSSKRVGSVILVTNRKKAHSGISSEVSKALSIQRKIDRMEVKYKNAKGKQMKDTIALAINAEHKKITQIQRALKSK